MIVFTSVTKSYIPKARVLAHSLKKFHPDWDFVLLLSDELPLSFDLESEPFDEIINIKELDIPNWKSWAFGHKVVELCTAVKGPAAELLAKRPNVDKIMYLDPDIKVFSSLAFLESLLDANEILLTPHLLKMENDIDEIQNNEISALKHGIYNLGFFAVKTTGQGLEFIKWWSSRLQSFCRDDIPNGLFTDQRWCDLAPGFFDKLHIVRDCGSNVASWNVSHRRISKNQEGRYVVGNELLKFYHFSSFDNGIGFPTLSKHKDFVDDGIVLEIWNDYKDDLNNYGQQDISLKNWKLGYYENGVTIKNEQRCLYRTRVDLQRIFKDPYSSIEPCFLSWWKINNNILSRFLVEVSILFNKCFVKIKKDGLINFVCFTWKKLTHFK
jgi:hypothetical protein